MRRTTITARCATAAVAATVLLAASTACANVIDGNPVAGATAPSATTTPPPRGTAPPFTEHAIDNECVLDAAEISALAGVDLDNGHDTETKRPDGTYGRSCTYYRTAGGVLSFTATIKIMRPQQGPVTDDTLVTLAKPGTRTITGIGRSVLIEAKTDFPHGWILTDTLIASVVLVGSNLPEPPSDDRWATAARRIVAVLSK